MQKRVARLTNLAMLATVSYIVMLVARFPLVPSAAFLEYEAKDVIIIIAGFLHGPVAAFCIAAVVAALQMVTVSTTAYIGFAMNLLSSAAFACTAAIVYSRRRSIFGAAAGLLAGVATMVASMLLWNYLITPLYMDVPRQVVAGMLLPVFLPFNLVKGALNAVIAFFLYKPLATALRATRLLPPREAGAAQQKAAGEAPGKVTAGEAAGRGAESEATRSGAALATDSTRPSAAARIALMLGAALVALACVAAIFMLRRQG